jgi:hypothetical protein
LWHNGSSFSVLAKKIHETQEYHLIEISTKDISQSKEKWSGIFQGKSNFYSSNFVGSGERFALEREDGILVFNGESLEMLPIQGTHHLLTMAPGGDTFLHAYELTNAEMPTAKSFSTLWTHSDTSLGGQAGTAGEAGSPGQGGGTPVATGGEGGKGGSSLPQEGPPKAQGFPSQEQGGCACQWAGKTPAFPSILLASGLVWLRALRHRSRRRR